MPIAVTAGGGSHIPRLRGEHSDGGSPATNVTTEENASLLEDYPEGTAAIVGMRSPDEYAYTTLRATTATIKAAGQAAAQQQHYQRTSKTVLQSRDRHVSGSSLAPSVGSATTKRSGTYPGAGHSTAKHRHAHRPTAVFENEERYLTLTPSFSWKHFLLAASAGVFAASAYYVTRNWDNLVNTRQIYYESQFGGRKAHADFRLFDMLRKANVAPRYTLLEKIDDRQGWVLQMDAPGFTKDDIKLHFSGSFMTIRGTHSCPVARNGRQDPTCMERHVSDEIRFPDEADMDTAYAEIENGVLRVFVKPNVNYKPGGRVIRIVEQALDKVTEEMRDMGETVKMKLGIGSRGVGGPPSASDIEIGRRYEDVWTFTAMDSEDVIRQKVDSFVGWLKQTFHVPPDLANDFLQRVRMKTKELIRQFRKGALSVSDLRERVSLAAEEVWAKLKEGIGHGSGGIRTEAAHAADRIRVAADTAETIVETVNRGDAKAPGVREAAFEPAKARQSKIEELGAEQAQKLRQFGETVKGAAKMTVDAAKEKVREYAENLKKGEEAASLRASTIAKDTGDRITHVRDFAAGLGEEELHRFAENAERSYDDAKEAVHRGAHRAQEAGERISHRAEETAHVVAHRVSEVAEEAGDRPRDAAHSAGDRRAEAAFHGQARARKASESSKGFADVLKEKFWGTA